MTASEAGQVAASIRSAVRAWRRVGGATSPPAPQSAFPGGCKDLIGSTPYGLLALK